MHAMRVATLLFLMAAAARLLGAGEVPRLLADINTQPDPARAISPSLPSGFFQLGGRLLFSTTGDNGALWSTDGTPAGTEAVSSAICPAPCESITPLATAGGITFLKVSSTSYERSPPRLWRTDGTPAGTFPLTGLLRSLQEVTFVAGSASGTGLLYFAACRRIEGCELWRSDGTRGGTSVVKDLEPGEEGSSPFSLTAWNDKLFFRAYTKEQSGLWSTDGTAAGTRFLTALENDTHEDENLLAATPTHFFFTSGPDLENLWVSDGTPEGTRLLREFETAPCPNQYYDCVHTRYLLPVGDAVYFTASDGIHGVEFWRSDGTENGTRPLTEVADDDLFSYSEPPQRLAGRWVFPVYTSGHSVLWSLEDNASHPLVVTGCEGGCPTRIQLGSLIDPGHLLFIGNEPVHGTELWITDGTGAGTRRLADVCPGPCDSLDFGATFETFAGWTYFFAQSNPSTYPLELWATDGTPVGTHRLAGQPTAIGFFGNRVYFGTNGPNGNSSELWTTEGTPASSRRVALLRTIAPGSFPRILPLRDGVLISASEGDHERLWHSAGTPEHTFPLREIEPGWFDRSTRVGELYFLAIARHDGGGNYHEEIWRTDGTAGGTFRIARLARRYFVYRQTTWNGKFVFSLSGPTGCSYWASDGTVAGTHEILPVLPGVRCPTVLQPFGSGFFFVARVESSRGGPVPQVFVSDGTLAGTRQISSIRGSREPFESEVARVGKAAFFRTWEPGYPSDTEVWRTDGTPEGTRRLTSPPYAIGLYGFRNALYYIARVGDSSFGFWRDPLDGSPPVLLTTAGPPNDDFGVFGDGGVTPVGDRLFFVAHDPAHGTELWVTDGTPAGTQLVRDVLPGPASSYPASLTAAGNRLFFSAQDGEHGGELWESDGTPAGTRMVWDLNPGGFSSSPSNLVISKGHLFFSADDGEAGFEPWVLRLEPR